MSLMQELSVPTAAGTVLNGVRFSAAPSLPPTGTVLIIITGVHGNFYSNPFYYTFGDTLSAGGFDFIYAQTNDAFNRMETYNVRWQKPQLIGSFKERFRDTDEDLAAYVRYAAQAGYSHIVLGGHSLGANKVIHYLANTDHLPVDHFFLLSPANIAHMTSVVSTRQRDIIRAMCHSGRGDEMLPFELLGWLPCIADTGWDWVVSDILDNVHTSPDGDFSQAARVRETGALLIGTYDNFTDGDPAGFLENINNHMPTASENQLIFIERTGHTYQMKHQETADAILNQMNHWYRSISR